MTVNINGYDMRYSVIEDGVYLKKWLNDPEMLHWFPVSEGKELEDAALCWIGFSKYLASLTALVNDKPCAIGTLFLMPYRKVAHHCLFKIIVEPKYQRKGIGSSLIKNLKNLAKTRFLLEYMYIETFEGNPIAKILEAQGFHAFVRQEKFVKENGKYLARILWEVKL